MLYCPVLYCIADFTHLFRQALCLPELLSYIVLYCPVLSCIADFTHLVRPALRLPELELQHPAVLGGEVQLSLQLPELVQLVLSERVVHLVHLPPQVAQLFPQLHVLLAEVFHLHRDGEGGL